MESNKWFRWLNRLNVTYQPVVGFEHKIKPERVKGFEKIRDTMLEHMGDIEGNLILDIGSKLGYFF